MRVAVVGCGAVGSLFAANLSLLDDVEVWAFDLNELHAAAINRGGLRLSGAGDVVGYPRATSDASELPPCDFGIVATKAMHTEAAIAATAHAFADGCVATVQNGLGNEETIAGHVERVIRDRLLVPKPVLDGRDAAVREGMGCGCDRRLGVHGLRRDDAEVARGQLGGVARRAGPADDVPGAREPQAAAVDRRDMELVQVERPHLDAVEQ